MQPRSNREKERRKYYDLLQLRRRSSPDLIHNALWSGTEKTLHSAARHTRGCNMFLHPITGQNLLMSGTDLLNGVTDTTVSQLSDTGQGIMCVKEGIGKYDMWYGVVCNPVMSCTSVVFSLVGGRDTVSCLVITVIPSSCVSHLFFFMTRLHST